MMERDPSLLICPMSPVLKKRCPLMVTQSSWDRRRPKNGDFLTANATGFYIGLRHIFIVDISDNIINVTGVLTRIYNGYIMTSYL